jgi:hypothetical protein
MVFGILLHTVVAGYFIFATSTTKIVSTEKSFQWKNESFHRKMKVSTGNCFSSVDPVLEETMTCTPFLQSLLHWQPGCLSFSLQHCRWGYNNACSNPSLTAMKQPLSFFLLFTLLMLTRERERLAFSWLILLSRARLTSLSRAWGLSDWAQTQSARHNQSGCQNTNDHKPSQRKHGEWQRAITKGLHRNKWKFIRVSELN